ncbi:MULTISPECIES: anthranilate synthase component 1 [unclassified Corynebacterium]|uniref:anthranilate synthase component 1 n=1 Tax=unclassified Corynebacterium TaxID=2624378 RepID=UPI0029CA1ABF|nr:MULTISPECIES: anthranilate synthase component 1 [unclassified Corynebacterium]WPF66135.1 anthranilate synthase component 1 [Corynebacterium sp. 22KM0430]WPF68628.1 anthranilate synthase component 1 [Corynebacterium sp. 21KM1197]
MTKSDHTQPHIIERNVTYHEDAAALFRELGGTDSTELYSGAALLESADISTRSGISSLAVLDTSLRLTCQGQSVEVIPLSPSGEHLAALLRATLTDYAAEEGFQFPSSAATEEAERLTAVSTVEPLRRLQSLPGFPPGLPLLVGGMAFDYLGTFEELPEVADSANTYPDYQFHMAEIMLDINHREQSAVLRAVAVGEHEATVRRRVDDLAEKISMFHVKHEPSAGDSSVSEAPGVSVISGPSSTSGGSDSTEPQGTLRVTAQTSDADFRTQVEEMKRHIDCGDIYQVVPARAFTAPCPDAFSAYLHLRDTNPSPYMFYLRGTSTDGRPYELFGASPESNLKFEAASRTLQLYPIAGTRPRGLHPDGSVNHELDIRQELAMRTDAKELSEHTMLVDLARNDLARVAEPGTRRVADLLQVDRYSRVMHLVSRVTATLAPDLDALDAYRACMNMGTLTGAPKLRATELLRGAEKQRRGSYGGAVGYLRGGGDMDTCIVIRSAFVQDGIAVVQAGAGVVRDSDPQSEADETLHKAYAVLHALALAADKNLEVVR